MDIWKSFVSTVMITLVALKLITLYALFQLQLCMLEPLKFNNEALYEK